MEVIGFLPAILEICFDLISAYLKRYIQFFGNGVSQEVDLWFSVYIDNLNRFSTITCCNFWLLIYHGFQKRVKETGFIYKPCEETLNSSA